MHVCILWTFEGHIVKCWYHYWNDEWVKCVFYQFWSENRKQMTINAQFAKNILEKI